MSVSMGFKGSNSTGDDGEIRINRSVLSKMVAHKEFNTFKILGGTQSLVKGLRTDEKFGLTTLVPEQIPSGEWTNPIDFAKEYEHEIAKERPRGTIAAVKVGTSYQKGELEWVDELEKLQTTFETRIKEFGINYIPQEKPKSFIQVLLIALNDKMIILLCIAATVSLALGIYQDVTGKDDDPDTGLNWIEGFSILVAVLGVVLVSSVNDFQKEKQFKKLNNKKQDRTVYVTRNGTKQGVSVNCVMVGDILHVEAGDVLCADAIVISGSNLEADESSVTGESDPVRKLTLEELEAKEAEEQEYKKAVAEENGEILESAEAKKKHDIIRHTDPFLISGSLIVNGIGECVVVAVGENSSHGRIMMSFRTEDEATPLQEKLNVLAEVIAVIGGVAAVLMLLILLLKYVLQLIKNIVPRDASSIIGALIAIIIETLTIIVVAIPEGLPLAVTLTLAVATVRMLKDNCLVRQLAACETMGNATTICSDKTGTLTQNVMTVVAGTVGNGVGFKVYPKDTMKAMPGEKNTGMSLDNATLKGIESESTEVGFHEFEGKVPAHTLELITNAIAVNSTAFTMAVEDSKTKPEGEKRKSVFEGLLPKKRKDTAKNDEELKITATDDHGTGRKVDSFTGSSTEVALLQWAQRMGFTDVIKRREESDTVSVYPFSSLKKSMSVLVKLVDPKDDTEFYRLYIKGAPEVLLKGCTKILNVSGGYLQESADSTEDTRESIPVTQMDNQEIERIEGIIERYASQALRTIGLAYVDIKDIHDIDMDSTDSDDVIKSTDGMTWLGVFGIEDPLRDGVTAAVNHCQRAGIMVRMVTGDNLLTAKAIAKQCGIYTPELGGVILEGRHFRKLSPEEMKVVVPRLQVLSRSSPEDKRVLVNWLKENGNVVAATGDGTNDGPALKAANIGFSMGMSGTEIAKEASDIILMDDNFTSIVSALIWGRCVNDSVKKFLQFQLTVNITAVFIAFITSVTSEDRESLFTSVQLLWLNLIMDTLAALALATDPPSPDLLNRFPELPDAPLITFNMWKNIFGQALFQIGVTFFTFYIGDNIFGLDNSNPTDIKVLKTITYNTFVFMQLFNEFNSRVLGSQINCFRGILKNNIFIAVVVSSAIIQAIIVTYGGVVFRTTKITPIMWLYCIGVAAITLPVGLVLRVLPNRWLWWMLPIVSQDVYREQDQMYWEPPAQTVQRQLAFLSMVRGGRLRSTNILSLRSRKASKEGGGRASDKQNGSAYHGDMAKKGMSPSGHQQKQREAILRVVAELPKDSPEDIKANQLVKTLSGGAVAGSPSALQQKLTARAVESSKDTEYYYNKLLKYRPKQDINLGLPGGQDADNGSSSGMLSKLKLGLGSKGDKKRANGGISASQGGFSFAAALVPSMVGASVGAGMSASSAPKTDEISDLIAKLLDEKE